MNGTKLCVVAVFFCAGLFSVSLIAQSNRNQPDPGQGDQPQFEYATLTTQISSESGNTTYQLTWNAGVLDIVGKSNSSLADARRRLTAQLGGGNNTHTNLSVLLSNFGLDGWRLIESNEDETGLVRIFIRARR